MTAIPENYLWDRSVPPDPQVQELEALLAPHAFRPRPLDLGRSERDEPVAGSIRARHRSIHPEVAAAAAALLLAALGAWMGRTAGSPPWRLEPLAGAPRVSQRAIASPAALRPGQWLQTDERSRARLVVGEIGDVTVEPGTRVRIKEFPGDRRLLQLAQGKIDAFITAPPRLFLVDTPAARAVDLGCAYTLEVDRDGAGVLKVRLGYVALEGAGLSAKVPRGASCLTRPGRGPGTPYFDDATSALTEALARFDAGHARATDLPTILAEARERDSVTLWHLLRRTSGAERVTVYDRLAALCPPPGAAGRAQVLALDAEALDRWWQTLPF